MGKPMQLGNVHDVLAEIASNFEYEGMSIHWTMSPMEMKIYDPDTYKMFKIEITEEVDELRTHKEEQDRRARKRIRESGGSIPRSKK